MNKKARRAAEYIARRTHRLVSQHLPPTEEALELLRLLSRADNTRFWRGYEPWPEDVEWVFGPVIERLAELEGEAVDAILDLEPPDESWQAELASSVLAYLLGQGTSEDRVADAVSWGLRLVDRQEEGFTMTMEEVTFRAGSAAEGPLARYLEGHEDGVHAATIVSFTLQDADPGWACSAATRMTREALDAGDVARANVFSYAVATACGQVAIPLLSEVLDRLADEGVETDRWVPGAFQASLLLGNHPGPEWDGEVVRFLEGESVEDYARGLGDDDLLATVGSDPGFLPRHELARACRLLGLDDGGSKPELLDRLAEAAVDGGPDLPRRRVPLESVPTAKLQQMCMDYRIDPGGSREELIGRLRELEEEAGTDRGYTRDELDGMSSAKLREVCREMGLETGGKRRALVARVQLAQEEEGRV